MADKPKGVPTQRVADALYSEIQDLAPKVAESLAGQFKGSQKLEMKDAVELASRRWADPQFRGRLLQAVGDRRFLAIGKALGVSDDAPATTEDLLKKMPF